MKFFFLFFFLLSCTSGPNYKGKKTDHFNGQRFFNKYSSFKSSFLKFLKWRLESRKGSWPKWIENKPLRKPKERGKDDSLTVTFINHATVLIQLGKINILTDPIYSQRPSPFSYIGPKRVRAPGVKFEDLPPIDVILISHNHYDHLDIPTLKKLSKRDHPIILTGLGNGLLFQENNIEPFKDMDWGDIFNHKGVNFHFLTSQHWSGRGFTDRLKTLWGSFLIEKNGKKIYFAGDTGYGPHFKEHAKRFGPIDLSLLPIGAYKPRWFMKFSHLSPEDALKAHFSLKSKKSMAIHFGTFSLGDDSFSDPTIDLISKRKDMGISEKEFWIPEFGESKNID
jgi:L-ascorbate metabolism protein UlaG (beta-lactamase superfamily)